MNIPMHSCRQNAVFAVSSRNRLRGLFTFTIKCGSGENKLWGGDEQ